MKMKESEEEFLARIRENVRERLERRLEFAERLVSRARERVPFPGQLMRVYEAVENGTKRILFADATGFGKTYVASMVLGLLNERQNRRHKVLLVAPGQSIHTAWTEKEINGYISGLGLQSPQLRVAELGLHNMDGVLRGNDIVSVNYHKFSCSNSDSYVEGILKMAPKIDLVIFDECQNNRNFLKRGNNIERLIDRTKNKRVLLLSATPGHNGLEDLGVPLHILRPEEFPFQKFEYNMDPTAIKDMILSGQWFNTDRGVVAGLFGLPKLTTEPPFHCRIGDYARDYLEIWRDGDLDICSKIAQLRKCSLLGKIKSREGRRDLENLLESFPKDHALVTFTHLKTGVSTEIFEFLERFYGKGNVAMINGDVHNVDERIEISRRFSDGKYRAISNSLLTMGEGIPCTTGDRPAAVLFLEMPYNHGQGDQAIGRVYRPGQKGEVRVFYALGKSEWLSKEMRKLVESGELQRIYDVEFPKNWRPSLIDLDIYEIMLEKERIDRERVKRGLTLDDFQQAVMSFREHSEKSLKDAQEKGVLLSLPRKTKAESAMSIFTRKGPILYGRGEGELIKASEGHGKYAVTSKRMVDAYLDERVFDSASGDTARLIKRVVEGLEGRGIVFRDLLDAGCGTGVVSRILGRKMTNLDLDERMLYPENLYPGKQFFGTGPRVKGQMTCMPFPDGSFDLSVFSYSLFYAQQSGDEREIEKILLENNRVLRPKQYTIITLERTTKESDFEKIRDAVDSYGFKNLVADFFFGYAEGGIRSDFKGVYLVVARKKADKKAYSRGGFSAYLPSKYRVSRAHSRKILTSDSLASRGPRVKVFQEVYSKDYKTQGGASINRLIEIARI